MNNKVKLLYILFTILPITSYAQGEIFKCVDSNGNITYANDNSFGVCQKTNLGQIDKGRIINKVPSDNKEESQNREQKRAAILKGELTQEKNQLQSVSEMLKKTNDSEQIKKLNELEAMHRRNVNALQKELGKTSDVELLLPSNINQPNVSNKDLPIGLPTENKQEKNGILSDVFNMFKKGSNKGDNNNENKTISNTDNPIEIQREIKSEEVKRIPLETNLITNKSIKNKGVKDGRN